MYFQGHWQEITTTWVQSSSTINMLGSIQLQSLISATAEVNFWCPQVSACFLLKTITSIVKQKGALQFNQPKTYHFIGEEKQGRGLEPEPHRFSIWGERQIRIYCSMKNGKLLEAGLSCQNWEWCWTQSTEWTSDRTVEDLTVICQIWPTACFCK